jgi:hypothetical protein
MMNMPATNCQTGKFGGRQRISNQAASAMLPSFMVLMTGRLRNNNIKASIARAQAIATSRFISIL